MKTPLIISHERSGTHFAINTVAKMLDLPNVQVDLPLQSVRGNPCATSRSMSEVQYSEMLFGFLSGVQGAPIVLKSHHDVRYFLPFWQDLTERFNVIYVVRDPLDCLCSCYHYFNKCPAHFPHSNSPEDFLFNINPTKYGFDWDYSYLKSGNMVERWFNHAYGYYSHCSGITVLHYEDLANDFDNTVKRLSASIGGKEKVKKPTVSDSPSVMPRKGVSGDANNLFSPRAIFDARMMIDKLFHLEERESDLRGLV